MVLSYSALVLTAVIISFFVTVGLVLASKREIKQGNETRADYTNRVMVVFAAGTFMALMVWVGTLEQASSK